MHYDFFTQRSHRPLPWPRGPWAMRMVWRDLLFAHWAVDPGLLAAQLPRGLELDLWAGSAWLGLVPFEMDGVGLFKLPGLPGVRRFLELNLRTYVRVGDVPGVWFFSLDADSKLAVRGARTLFHLPYMDAAMACSREGQAVSYASRRTHRGAPPAELQVRYAPAGKAGPTSAGSLEAWLTERYCLFAADARGRVFQGDIHHLPWSLASARADFAENTMASSLGFELSRPPDSLLFSERLDVVAWGLRPASRG